jgi:hypothetical protein
LVDDSDDGGDLVTKAGRKQFNWWNHNLMQNFEIVPAKIN